jgi:hypothetical protein
VTQIQTVRPPSAAQGPRGIGAHGLGGVYAPINQQDLTDGDAFQGAITVLSGTSDVINPHASGNYIIAANAGASLDAITLGLPTAGVDDGVSINIYSDTAFAHTVTLPTTAFAAGLAAGLKTVATFTAGRGAGISLRAYNGVWQVVGVSPAMAGTSFT